MVDAIVSTIVEKLTDLMIDKASEAWKLVRGVEQEVKRLQSNFEALQIVLEDAEEKQYLDKFLKHWFDRFQDVSYDMEDVLDDWQTAVLQRPTPRLKVCDPLFSCFSSGSQFVRRHGIAARIKQINEEVEKIVQEKAKFELVKKETKQLQPSKTTTFVDVSRLIGRDKVRDDMIKILLCGGDEEGNRNIPTISIVGMGGLGKTSLAQLIYNDDRVKNHFNKIIIWVSVGDPFNLTQIAQAILGELKISVENSTLLQNLLGKISESIRGKKFFLVLDDVWTDRDEDLELLKVALKEGRSGSCILVTTRKRSVATQMDPSHVFPLELLGEEVCWSILSQNAFAGRDDGSSENFEDIGRKLARKCEGLPLAAKALGGLLRDKTRREEWENVLKSEIWKPKFENEIFRPLMLSYFDLPSEIRQCLSYCAIFPKNWRIDKDELIQHWMAQGYLNGSENAQGKLKGEDHVKYLVARSFFQNLVKDTHNGEIISFKMHYLVHDFVQFLTKDRFVSEEVVEDLILNLSSKRARHLRLIVGKGRYLPMSIGGTEKLRSLVVVSDDASNNATAEAFNNLFRKSKHLRFLEFQSLHLDAKRLADICTLIHLRYLGMTSCDGMENLPEAVCELSNLQFLILQWCWDLKKLPDGIGKLINLRYLSLISCFQMENLPETVCELSNLQSLNVQHCWDLKKLPDGIRKLINLRYLSLIACPMENLPEAVCDLSNLQSLNLQRCRNLKKLPDGIGKLINLKSLCTESCFFLTDYPKGISNLTSLIRLSDIKVRADCNDVDKFSIGDLEKLDLLGGNLNVDLIGDEIDRDEARRANLRNKKHLKSLVIRLFSRHIKEREVHEALNPPSGLQLRFINRFRDCSSENDD